MKTSDYKYLDLIMAAFVTVLIVSNVASCAKIVDLRLNLFGQPLAFDGGTLLFPLSYIFGDIFTEVYGFRASRRVIWTGFAALLFSALIFFVLRTLPGEAEWESYAGSAAYDAILGGLSSGGIVLASVLGYFAGEYTNSVTLSLIKISMKGKILPVRTIGSTLAGEAVDSLVFVGVACLTGVFAWSLFVTLLVTNYILKCLIEAAMTPVTCLVIGRLKKMEGVDVYDTGVSFSPLPVFRA